MVVPNLYLPDLAPNSCLPTLTETFHLLALVSKLYLPTLTPAMVVPNLYLPVQDKILVLLPPLLALSLPLLLPQSLLLLLLLPIPLLLIIITRDAFVVAKFALNGP